MCDVKIWYIRLVETPHFSVFEWNKISSSFHITANKFIVHYYCCKRKMVKSDLIELPTEVIRSALCETVENQLKSKNYKINVSSASQNGESNFMGVLHRISFSKKGADEDEKGKSLVLKVAPQDMMLRDKRFSRSSFMREIHMYDKVSHNLSQ